MSLKKSISQQSKLDKIIKGLKSDFHNERISDVILLEYPKWSIYYHSGSHIDSYEFDATTRRSIFKYLKTKVEE